MKPSMKVNAVLVCLAFVTIAVPSIANSQSMYCDGGPGSMALYNAPAPSYYVGDYMVLAVQSIPGDGIADFYYQYSNGPLQLVRSAGNFVHVSVQTTLAGPQNLRAIKTGFFGTCTLSAFVYNLPTATINSITGSQVTVSPISFSGSVSGGAGGNTYLWTFGDGETSTELNPTHIYNSSGTFQVSFKGTDQNNKVSTIAAQAITIADNPNVPGKPTFIIPEFANCNGQSPSYQLGWNPTGQQPSNYFSYKFKPTSSTFFYPIQWLLTNTKLEGGLTSSVSYNVEVRGCLTANESTCGPVRERTFTAQSCGAGGGGGRHTN